MKTEKANATNNFLVRLWSAKYYGEKHTKSRNLFHGQITDTDSGVKRFFNTGWKFERAITELYEEAEIRKTATKKHSKKQLKKLFV